MPRVLCLDPGESTGWFFYDGSLEDLYGEGYYVKMGTVPKNYRDIGSLIGCYKPDVVVFETFNLYPGSAKSLTWNSFYPCEVIGIIKYVCECIASSYSVELIPQAPSVKGYSGGLDDNWIMWKKQGHEVTEHTKDAYLHFRYYCKNLKKKKSPH